MHSPSDATFPDEVERQRLQALHAHALLDTGPEAGTEALVRVAAQLFGMPMAAIGLLDADRLWLKARIGVDAQALPREGSLCDSAAEQAPGVLVIEDLKADPRACGQAWALSGQAAQFCAMATISDEQGQALGCITVLDTQVRSFTAAQASLMQDLALLASQVLQARQRERLLMQSAQSDALTGAAGAPQFEQMLDVELQHAMRSGEGFAVLRLDLDGFGDINIAYGQVAGDAVLREVGRRLNQQVRLGDLLARLGSDDFGIVMRHGGADEAQMLAARIMSAVCQPIDLGNGRDEVSPGVSIGVAAYSDDIASVAELLALAEESLRAARAQKESRWMVFGKIFSGEEELKMPPDQA